MVNNFKTNVSEIKGTKIYALDPRMAMINRYLKLWYAENLHTLATHILDFFVIWLILSRKNQKYVDTNKKWKSYALLY